MSISLVVLVVVASVPPSSSAAQTAPTPAALVPSRPRRPEELQLQPEQAPAPERPAPLLRRYIPGLQAGMEKLPAFIRDTEILAPFTDKLARRYQYSLCDQLHVPLAAGVPVVLATRGHRS